MSFSPRLDQFRWWKAAVDLNEIYEMPVPTYSALFLLMSISDSVIHDNGGNVKSCNRGDRARLM